MQLKAIIVEDELRSREFLKKLVQEFCPAVNVIDLAFSVEDAVERINNLKPDVLFLDIELHTGTGFDVLEKVSYKDFHVIFTTAYDHYAVKAIKFSAVDYLLKPIDVDELQAAVQKVSERMKNNNQESLQMLLQNLRKPAETDFSITLATSNGLEFVPLNQIIRLEASGPYTHFFMKEGKKIMVSKNLKEYETLLSDHNFFRVHNSHIINMKEVKRMVKTDGGYAVMNDDSMITISPKKKDEFMQQIGQRLV
ncbi:MAG: LytTR family DNA-binding domain-containing protein [Ferruginibacter sp.]